MSDEALPERTTVSVIIPTRNSGAYLERCLASVTAQTYSPIEIIIVDNFSTDETPALAAAHADKFLQAGPERSAQFNAGVRAASGTYIYRVDADFVLDPRVVEQAVAACNAGADVVAVHNDSDSKAGLWAKVRNFERSMYRDDDLIVGARFMTKAAFNAVNGFDEQLIAGEDYDLHNRLLKHGFIVARIPAGEVHLGEPRSLREIIGKSFFYGGTIGPFLSKSGARGVRQLSPLRSAYVRHWPEFLKHPFLALAFLAMQVTKYAAGALGLVFGMREPGRVARTLAVCAGPLAAAFAFFVFRASGVPAALFGAALAGVGAYLGVGAWNRPRLLAVGASAFIVLAGLFDLLFGESAPETTAAIVAAVGLLAIAAVSNSHRHERDLARTQRSKRRYRSSP